MSTYTITSILGALSLAAIASVSAAAPEPSADAAASASTPAVSTPPRTSSVKITATRAYRPRPDEFRDIGGSYRLDNGATLNFTNFQNRYFATITGLPKIEVFPQGPNVFAAKDHDINIVFKPDDRGDATEVILHYSIG